MRVHAGDELGCHLQREKNPEAVPRLQENRFLFSVRAHFAIAPTPTGRARPVRDAVVTANRPLVRSKYLRRVGPRWQASTPVRCGRKTVRRQTELRGTGRTEMLERFVMHFHGAGQEGVTVPAGASHAVQQQVHLGNQCSQQRPRVGFD